MQYTNPETQTLLQQPTLHQLCSLILYDTAEPPVSRSRFLFGAVGAAGSYVFFPLGQDSGEKLATTLNLTQPGITAFSWFFGLTSILPTILLGYMSASKHGILLTQKLKTGLYAHDTTIEDYFHPLHPLTSFAATTLILLLSFYAGLQRMYLTQDNSDALLGHILMIPAFLSAFSVYYNVYDSYKRTAVHFCEDVMRRFSYTENVRRTSLQRSLLTGLDGLMVAFKAMPDSEITNFYQKIQDLPSPDQQLAYILIKALHTPYHLTTQNTQCYRIIDLISYTTSALGSYAYYVVGRDAAKFYFTENPAVVVFSSLMTFLTVLLMYSITTSLYLPKWIMRNHERTRGYHTQYPCLRTTLNTVALFFGFTAGIPPVDLTWQTFASREPKEKWPLIISFGLSAFISHAAFSAFAVVAATMQFFDQRFKPTQQDTIETSPPKQRDLLLGIIHRTQHYLPELSSEAQNDIEQLCQNTESSCDAINIA